MFDHRLAEDKEVPTWYQANLARLFVYVEEPLRSLAPDMEPQERTQRARARFSAVNGILLKGRGGKLQTIPLSTVREQVTFIVEAFARGLVKPSP